MTLSPEEREAIRHAIETVHELNEALEQLRRLHIASNIREIDNRWLLDAKPLILREHYA